MTADIELLPFEYLRTLPAHCRGRIDAYARANVSHATAPLQAEIKALRVEVERLNRYYKNGIDCFANPCEKHSGERTPPFSEFFEKYGGQCLICVVDNNKALQAEIEALLSDLADYMRIANTEAARADRLEEALEFQSALTKSLLPYQDEAVASRAEIKALRVDVEAWKASHSMLTDTCHHFQAQAKRLAEALRHQRWCRTCAEDGWESCEEGRKNDALLRDQEEGK